ncbi:MAG TPA: hypothetical protein VGG90_02385 [Candidatus Dormibacteraeota bacterium]
MDKSPILPAEHDARCQRTGAGGLDVEHCERCRNLLARLDQWRGTLEVPASLDAKELGTPDSQA